MILFVLLTLVLTILAIVVGLAASIGGAAFIIVFGDVIVCIFLIVWIIKKIIKGRKKKGGS